MSTSPISEMLARALLLAHVALGGASVAVPTAAQLEWMDMEVGAMITYNLQTYCQPASAPGGVRVRSPRVRARGSERYHVV